MKAPAWAGHQGIMLLSGLHAVSRWIEPPERPLARGKAAIKDGRGKQERIECDDAKGACGQTQRAESAR